MGCPNEKSTTMMTSSQDHRPNRDRQRTSSAEDTINNSSSNNNHGDNNHDHDRENGRPQSPPQQAMGYPPVMGYPPPGQYPYNAYPGATGYYSPNQPPFLLQQHPPQSLSMSRFASGILALVVFFVVLSCMISIGAYVILHPVNPEFHITGLSVTGFSVVPGVSVTGSFEANVTVANPNEKLRVRFHRIESYVYYKNPRGELAWTTAAPFLMEKNTTHMMTVRVSADGDVGGDDGEMSGDEEAATEMEKDQRNGRVEMGLEMGMWATFRSEGGWWSSRVTMRVQCDGLPVGFASRNGTTQGTGAWTCNGLPKECSTYR